MTQTDAWNVEEHITFIVRETGAGVRLCASRLCGASERTAQAININASRTRLETTFKYLTKMMTVKDVHARCVHTCCTTPPPHHRTVKARGCPISHSPCIFWLSSLPAYNLGVLQLYMTILEELSRSRCVGHRCFAKFPFTKQFLTSQQGALLSYSLSKHPKEVKEVQISAIFRRRYIILDPYVVDIFVLSTLWCVFIV